MWLDFLTDGEPGTGFVLNNGSGTGDDKLARKGPSSGILEVGHLVGPIQLSKVNGFLEGFEFTLNVESQTNVIHNVLEGGIFGNIVDVNGIIIDIDSSGYHGTWTQTLKIRTLGGNDSTIRVLKQERLIMD